MAVICQVPSVSSAAAGFPYAGPMRWRRVRDWLATAAMALVIGALLMAMLGAVVAGGLAIVGGLIVWLTR